ncbi:pyridoxal-phosphate dependent enzyme [Rhizobium sp. YIM 134829]|uniref:pyridoxal-phosphate dependent enzyme n=1 Tax=Rhizobium sp. YIM 134829 TaxID=3390453 RepID=UPI00397DDC96
MRAEEQPAFRPGTDAMTLRCIACDAAYPAELLYRCAACGGILEVSRIAKAGGWANADFVDPAVTLGEGGTPLRAVAPDLLHSEFHGRLFLKDETRNPSGSFKDRLVAASLSRAIEQGARGIVSASSGNAGAAAACYAAHAGTPAIICCPEATPHGKLAQILAYGATLERVPGHYGNAFRRAMALCEERGYVNLTTTYLNPYGVDALRLVGQEILDGLDGVGPDWVAVPTSSGPLVKGVFQGFKDAGAGMPRLVAAQSEGCAPIAKAFAEGTDIVQPWTAPRTIASGISDPLLGYPEEGSHTLSLVRESGGTAVAVPDDEIRAAMIALARQAGLFSEPTGAASLAACRRLFLEGTINAGDTVVCIVTGHGFKDVSAWENVS